MNAMRKFCIVTGLALAAPALMNCQRDLIEEMAPVSEPNFELFAQPVSDQAASTKTVNEGLATKWAEGDAINVFHAAAGSKAYVSDDRFDIKDAEAGSFSGTVASLGNGSHDWYAFYPHTPGMGAPDGSADGWALVGGRSQTQTGNGSRAHLSGAACPLYGVVRNVDSDEKPSLVMNHLTSVIKVRVKNSCGAAQTVKSVSFTGTEDIAGWYKVNFASSPVGYEAGNNVSSTASLSVNGGAAIADGAEADFYIAVKPFKASKGSVLKIAVNGYEKPITLDRDVTFTAGRIKQLNFSLDKKPEYPEQLIARYYKKDTYEPGDKATVLNAVADNAGHYQGFLYTDPNYAEWQNNFLFHSSEDENSTIYRGDGEQYKLTSASGYYYLWSGHPGLNYVAVDLTSLAWTETKVERISVTGDFNNWNLTENVMTYNSGTRKWEAVCKIGSAGQVKFAFGDGENGWKWEYGDSDQDGVMKQGNGEYGIWIGPSGTYKFELDLSSFDAPTYTVTDISRLYAYYYTKEGTEKLARATALNLVEGETRRYEGFLYTDPNWGDTQSNFRFLSSESGDATVYCTKSSSQYSLTTEDGGWNLWSGHPGLNYVTVDLDKMTWEETEMDGIAVAGDFNNWSTTANAMTYDPTTRKWEAVCEVSAAGKVQFVPGGNWERKYGDSDGDRFLTRGQEGFGLDAGKYRIELDLNDFEAPRYAVNVVANASQADERGKFASGGDISWMLEKYEYWGRKFYNREGKATECTALMKEEGMNAIRLRVWVENPTENPYGWNTLPDVLEKAKRVRDLGMRLMIDFHYSDNWADPGQQRVPAAWASIEDWGKRREAIYNHTYNVLSELKRNNIDVEWVQIGNETTNGMLYDWGSYSNSSSMQTYAWFSNAGYEAAKSVYPDVKAIVHLDNGWNLWAFQRFFRDFRKNGGKMDMIGMSYYPYWYNNQKDNANWPEANKAVEYNIRELSKEFGVDCMIVEIGYPRDQPAESRKFLEDMFRRALKWTDGHCAGIFWWEPEAFDYANGAMTDDARPSEALIPFGEYKSY